MSRENFLDVYPWVEACFNHPSVPIEGIFRHAAALAKMPEFALAALETRAYDKEILRRYSKRIEEYTGKQIRIIKPTEKHTDSLWMSIAVDSTCPFINSDNFGATAAILHDTLALRGHFGGANESQFKAGVKSNKYLFAVSKFAVDCLALHLADLGAEPMCLYIGCPVKLPKEGIKKLQGIDSLSVFTVLPRKNFAGLLDYVQANPAVRHCHVGAIRSVSDEDLRRAVELQNLRLLGFVSDDVLEQLYASVSVLVQPSDEEGFSMPPMEALMRSNIKRVFLSDIPVHREIYSDIGAVKFVRKGTWKSQNDWDFSFKRDEKREALCDNHRIGVYRRRVREALRALDIG